MSKRFATSLGPVHDADGKLQGEHYQELQDRADEMRQLEAVREEARARKSVMAHRMANLDLEPEEWKWEVEKRDLEIRRWAEKWQHKQWAINQLAEERGSMRLALLELKQDLGHMASAEERNGNYKTADVLRMVTLRLKDVVQDKTEQEPRP